MGNHETNLAECAGQSAIAAELSEPAIATFSTAGDNPDMSVKPTNFHELYERYAGDVYRFAYWLSGNPDDARDITSETFVRVWTAPEPVRMESVKGYLFAIARNLHRKDWRRKSRQSPLDDSVFELPDTKSMPHESAASSDELKRTLDAMKALPEIDRTVLLLRAEGGLSYEEIAATTGISVVSAKVKVFRARARLSELLNKEQEKKET